jgi:RNA polymerase sigma-70 factor (ECF subfamily)
MEEKDLIAGCREGDPDSARNLFETHFSLVMAMALNVLGNRQDAEDACQETFLQVFKNIERYDPERSFKTWLLTIVYRRSLDMIKKRRRFKEFAARAKFEPLGSPSTGNPGPGGTGPLPSELLEVLSPRERTALCLWANEGYTAGDIAEIMACSASTARVTLFNARRKIKPLLEKDHGVLQTG